MQFGFVLGDETGRVLRRYETLLRPTDWSSISAGAEETHGIAIEHCRESGIENYWMASDLLKAAEYADVIVAHNMSFDRPVVLCELLRLGTWGARELFTNCACTMKLGTPICAEWSPTRCDYKWPSLTKLHHHLFGKGFDGAHGALADAEACYRCYVEILKRESTNV